MKSLARLGRVAGVLLSGLVASIAAPKDAPVNAGASFESLGAPVRKGGLMGCLIGPDGRGGEALYFNFNQIGGLLFLVQVNPNTGEARQFNAPQGPGAWAFIAGPDGKIYLGTWDGALILRFDPEQPDKGLEVIGKPAATEEYLWQFAAAPDGRLYACTYPGAKLVRFDPKTGAMEDLGRMHPTEMYARSVAVGPTGKVYAGIGTSVGDLVMFDPATGRHRSILPPNMAGTKGWNTVDVSRRRDGGVYAEYGAHSMRIDDETPALVDRVPEPPPLRLRDGREVTDYGRGTFTLRDAATGRITERQFQYSGAGDYLFVLGQGPGGQIYGSTAMPLEVFRFDPKAGASEHLGGMPGGEVYSMMEQQGKLYLCYYGGAVMNLYDPAKRFWKFGAAPDSNPISFGGVGDGHLRPRAMIRGPEGLIYIGSEPPYGELGGALGVWDPRLNKTIENYRHLISDQSIVSLAWETNSGLIFGGSGNFGGGGTKPTQPEAKFFAFDPLKKQLVFEAALAPGARSYPATAVAGGRVFTTAGNKLLALDPIRRQVIKTLDLPGRQIEISLGTDRGGKLVGLTDAGVYVVDPASLEIVHAARAPVRVSCGFALADGAVYFGSRAELWRYRLP